MTAILAPENTFSVEVWANHIGRRVKSAYSDWRASISCDRRRRWSAFLVNGNNESGDTRSTIDVSRLALLFLFARFWYVRCEESLDTGTSRLQRARKIELPQA